MEKSLRGSNQLWRAILAIAIGLLFVIWPESIIGWVVLFIGIISLLTGGVQVGVYLSNRKKEPQQREMVPLLGILLIIWGLLLLLQPKIWVNLFMVVMSIPIILLSIDQIVLLVRKKRAGFMVKWGYYIFPVLLFLAGVTVMINPFGSALWLVSFVGLWVIAYGVIEMVNSFSIRN